MDKKYNKKYISDDTRLMDEWDWEKNTHVSPSELSSGSHTVVWWKCTLGHSWSAAVAKRFMGQNCPFCSGRKAWRGWNDLGTTHPDLISQWDFEKNETQPYEYRPMSNKKVWWKCSQGHSWEATISKRVQGSGCPVCKGKIRVLGYNDLGTTCPELLEEWDYEKNQELHPTDVSKGSMKKVWWKCARNHSWRAAIYSRESGVGCPYCNRKLQTSFPEKAVYFYVKKAFPDAVANYRSEQLGSLELDVFIPSLKIGVEYDGERWHQVVEKDLSKNKICTALGIVLIRIREPDCPILSDNLSICIIRESKKTGLEKDIEELFSVIYKIANIDCSVDIDLSKDCTSILELFDPAEKENSLYSKKLNFISEWDYKKNGTLLPSMVTVGSENKVWWVCSQGHSYQAMVSSRARGRNCPICSGKKVLKGYNDLESRYPLIAREWDLQKNNITPDMVAFGTDKKYWWTCDKGHSYECSVNNRRAGQSCYYCSGKRVLTGFNDIATTHPDVARQWCNELNVLSVNEVSAGSHKKIWWECKKCGNRWISNVYNRCHNGAGCPKCSAKARRK